MPVPCIRREYIPWERRTGQVSLRASLANPYSVKIDGALDSRENFNRLANAAEAGTSGLPLTFSKMISSTLRVSFPRSAAFWPQVLPITSRDMQPTDPESPKSSGESLEKLRI